MPNDNSMALLPRLTAFTIGLTTNLIPYMRRISSLLPFSLYFKLGEAQPCNRDLSNSGRK